MSSIFKKNFSLEYKDVLDNTKKRYLDYNVNNKFHAKIKRNKENNKLCYISKLDPQSSKSQEKSFYISNIWQVLDYHYHKNN